MKRPTIPDLARAAGVSVSTVNRALNDPESVRPPTLSLVLSAAEQIGFYGLGTIEHAVRMTQESHRLGVLLQSKERTFYRVLGEAIAEAAQNHPHGKIELIVEHLEDLTPEKVAAHILSLGRRCESLAIVAPQHHFVADAIDTVLDLGVPVTSLIGPLSAKGNLSFVGLDNWKVGRTAAWAFNRMVRVPGKIGILVGSHRLRNQEMNESGFRSYFREHNTDFTLLEPLPTYESAVVAREHVEKLLTDHPDLCGLFISGGGVTGAIAALRAMPKRPDFVTVGYELFDATRSALIDGTISLLISHPIERFGRETIATLLKAKLSGSEGGAHRVTLDFDIYTPESV
ncbi:LacI family DNA-binding transcriptional regulator [Pseudotabrizicola sp.]|uniref:LacI family DNA-binding transcriptional regulator n=1 Tax=Pseudotabrizicola sp. TaxID=2939647 RepID=UPI002731B01D|nr:LacI family DNA-binding transcriptional regulator [Pseudotabrizicola sp.]MDP2081077.1 LacI family DNA-binding transcriptional regulator [Pseudotabrizicola sp.]